MSVCSDVHMLTIEERAAVTPEKEACETPHPALQRPDSRGLSMSDSAVTGVAETFRILGDPTRIRILDALSAGELCVCDIAGFAGISESAVSHQLRLLRSMRLVKSRRSGRLVIYALDDHHIIELLRQAHTHVQEKA